MPRRTTTFGWAGVGGLCVGLLLWNLGAAQAPPPEPPKGPTYMPVVEQDLTRGIKDSPPYLHDGRLLALEDTVEFFNLVLGVQLTPREKAALVAFMRQL